MIHNSNHTTRKKELFNIYIWTLSYFKPFILQTFIYILSGGAMIYGELMIPRRMGFLIDHVLPLKNMDLLIRQVFLLGVVALVILISKSIYNYMEIIISNNIIRNQQRDLMKKLQELGFSYYEKNPTGKILSLFENSVREVQKTYNFLFPNFIYCLAQFVVPSIILIYNQPKFFIAAMIGNIIYVFINQYANKKIHYYLGVETSAAHISQQSLYDAISSVTELKAMGSEKWFIDKVTQDFNDYRKPRMGSIFWRHFRFTTVGLTLTISIILFYLFGLELLRSGELMLGEFIGYSFLMGLVSRGFSVFFYIIPAQYHALSYGKDLYEFMSLEPEVLEAQDALDVEIKNFDIELNN